MRSLHFILLALFLPLLVFNNFANAQGLAERRAIKTYQEGKFVELQKQINEAAGFEVPLTVDWGKLAVTGQADNYNNDDYMTNIYFVPVINAFKAIATDDLGKTALKDGLKGLHITFDEQTAPASNYKNGITFEGGKATINWKPFSNSSDIELRAQALQEVLEAKL